MNILYFQPECVLAVGNGVSLVVDRLACAEELAAQCLSPAELENSPVTKEQWIDSVSYLG